jgi:hypothetical protein
MRKVFRVKKSMKKLMKNQDLQYVTTILEVIDTFKTWTAFLPHGEVT